MDGEQYEWWRDVPPETLQVALTLAQTTWWVDSEATPHLVDAMSDQHRRAVLIYLSGRSEELMLDAQETFVRSSPTSAPYRAAASLLAADPRLSEHRAWLESTPLVRRLRLLVRDT